MTLHTFEVRANLSKRGILQQIQPLVNRLGSLFVEDHDVSQGRTSGVHQSIGAKVDEIASDKSNDGTTISSHAEDSGLDKSSTNEVAFTMPPSPKKLSKDSSSNVENVKVSAAEESHDYISGEEQNHTTALVTNNELAGELSGGGKVDASANSTKDLDGQVLGESKAITYSPATNVTLKEDMLSTGGLSVMSETQLNQSNPDPKHRHLAAMYNSGSFLGGMEINVNFQAPGATTLRNALPVFSKTVQETIGNLHQIHGPIFAHKIPSSGATLDCGLISVLFLMRQQLRDDPEALTKCTLDLLRGIQHNPGFAARCGKFSMALENYPRAHQGNVLALIVAQGGYEFGRLWALGIRRANVVDFVISHDNRNHNEHVVLWVYHNGNDQGGVGHYHALVADNTFESQGQIEPSLVANLDLVLNQHHPDVMLMLQENATKMLEAPTEGTSGSSQPDHSQVQSLLQKLKPEYHELCPMPFGEDPNVRVRCSSSTCILKQLCPSVYRAKDSLGHINPRHLCKDAEKPECERGLHCQIGFPCFRNLHGEKCATNHPAHKEERVHNSDKDWPQFLLFKELAQLYQAEKYGHLSG